MWDVDSKNKMNENLKDIGFIKHMMERLRNNLSYIQMPLLAYTALVSTLNYVPELSGYLAEFLITSSVLFVIFASIAVYIDYKWVFPAERDFIFKKTPHLEKRFNAIDEKLDELLEAKCSV